MKSKYTYTVQYLASLPTLHEGHFDNLKIETPTKRVWLSRMRIEDGMPYNNEVTVEQKIKGDWVTVKTYEAK